MRTFLFLMLAASTGAAAQMPGVPVLQNAWATPGLIVAADFAGGGNSSVWGAAVAWAPATRGLQLSASGGMQSLPGATSRGVYGARVAMPVAQLMSGSAGLAAFAGLGGGAASASDSLAATTLVPVGLSFGYRHAMGSRGISFYASPSYLWASTPAGSSTGLTVGLGVDIGLASNLGVTGGLQFGQSGGTSGGMGRTAFGFGASYVLGRR